MLGEPEEDIPSRDQNHIVLKTFLLDLRLLHDNDISLENIEHSLELSVQNPRTEFPSTSQQKFFLDAMADSQMDSCSRISPEYSLSTSSGLSSR